MALGRRPRGLGVAARATNGMRAPGSRGTPRRRSRSSALCSSRNTSSPIHPSARLLARMPQRMRTSSEGDTAVRLTRSRARRCPRATRIPATTRPTPQRSSANPCSVPKRISTDFGALNFCRTSTATGITESTSRVRRVCAVEAWILSATPRRSAQRCREVRERGGNSAASTPLQPNDRGEESELRQADVIGGHAQRGVSASRPARRLSRTPRRMDPAGSGVSLGRDRERFQRGHARAREAHYLVHHLGEAPHEFRLSPRVHPAHSYQATPAPAGTDGGKCPPSGGQPEEPQGKPGRAGARQSGRHCPHQRASGVEQGVGGRDEAAESRLLLCGAEDAGLVVAGRVAQ